MILSPFFVILFKDLTPVDNFFKLDSSKLSIRPIGVAAHVLEAHNALHAGPQTGQVLAGVGHLNLADPGPIVILTCTTKRN